jgi:hypothetical protein
VVCAVGKIDLLPELLPTSRADDRRHPISTPSQRIKMSLAASRAVLRQSTFAVRRAGIRNASTTAEATNTVKDTASKVQSKASEGLTKVTSSASSAVSGAGSAVSNASQAATGRVGRMVNFVQGQSHSSRGWELRAMASEALDVPKRAGRGKRGAQWLA